MSILAYIILFTLLGSVGGLLGGIILLLLKEKYAFKISHFLASFAAGILLGAAFFNLLHEAAHEGEELGINIFPWVLLGIVSFFILERFLYFHHHTEIHSEKKQTKPILPLIIFGDTIHNFMDGIVIAATFMVNIPLGIATTLSVFAHEIPQEIGDFGLMLHMGLKPKKIIAVNILSALAALAGALITYLLGDILKGFTPMILAMTAGFFIYIAASDLIPEIHHQKKKSFAYIQSLLLIAGIVVMWISVSLLEHGH